MRKRQGQPTGIVLIFVAGILTIMAALGMAFFTICNSSTKSAVRYSDMVRAELLAQAGIQYGISMLRAQLWSNTEDASNAWYPTDYLRGAKKRTSFPALSQSYSAALGSSIETNSDRFSLNIEDAASRININAGDNLAIILDNLCRAVGPPLVAANLDAIQPRRWAVEADPADPVAAFYATPQNVNDTPINNDLYFTMTDESGAVVKEGLSGRPLRASDGTALYGDAYAIAGYRARHGAFKNLEDVKNALTYVERNGTSAPDDPLEQLEIEAKFAAIRDHITIGSWVDTNTVCVGKFEWVHVDTATGKTYAIDRDKSWVVDDPVNDPLNERGSLRGCYLSIMNGHGAGQLRRIRTNGIDWVEVESGFAVTPGPISSYMIIAGEEAMLMDVDGKPSAYSYPNNPPPPGTITFPQTNPDGTFVSNPKIDYSLHPLCIHRAPVNVNTATDKVLVALLLGINVQHGHPLALGTDADVWALRAKWKMADIHLPKTYPLTAYGLKRIPEASGKVILNRTWGGAANQVPPPPSEYDLSYLNNCDTLNASSFGAGPAGTMTAAHELAYRIIMARQIDPAKPVLKYIDPITGGPVSAPTYSTFERGPFRTYDDLYFRVIKPWDDAYFAGGWVDKNGDGLMDDSDEYHRARLSKMIMANLNANTDILKFNPNIEWIDRWGRNFTEMEPVMVYTNEKPPADGIFRVDVPAADVITAASIPLYTAVTDPFAKSWAGTVTPIKSSQRGKDGKPIEGAYITRSFRYKSDELIDKTDLNRSTTEFSFDSNGIFEVTSTGQVSAYNSLQAERKAYALVKIYDVWRESTQQQFVMGIISKACGGRGSTCSGQLTRDASGLVERKGLVTLPEPLLPLKARIVDHNEKPNLLNREAVSGVGTGSDEPLNAFGKPRKNPYDPGAGAIDVPDVLANRVLPARYDGQLALSTNTSAYDPSTAGDADTFLASFDGDLDTATCLGNGREQAKWPYSAEPDGSGGFKYTGHGYKHRCVDSIGLLGLLNDTLVASDPGIPLIDGTTPYSNWATDKNRIRWIYPFIGISSVLTPLKLGADPERPAYWNNITLRMGSLRTDGAYLSAPGVSGNTGTLKYLFTPSAANRRTKLNFQPDSLNGNCVTMWAKTVWHHDDMRSHEFFNPNNESKPGFCVSYFFRKAGQYKWTSGDDTSWQGQCANRKELNGLGGVLYHMWNRGSNLWVGGQRGGGHGVYIHGGYEGVASSNESPGYRVQPFRWSFLGYRNHYQTDAPCPSNAAPCPESQGFKGHLISTADYSSPSVIANNKYYFRPFIDTALFPEAPENWDLPTTLNNLTSTTPISNGYRLRWGYRGDAPWVVVPNYYGDARDVVGGPTSAVNPNPHPRGNPPEGEGQDAKWVWADPYGKIASDPQKPSYSLKSFGMNNLNFGNPVYNMPFDGLYEGSRWGSAALMWHYRDLPEDGTYAVIDELKISSKDRVLVYPGSPAWNEDRVSREMQLSRYYLPPKPGTRVSPDADGPPTFTSQTLLQSRKGFDKASSSQSVAVARVSWNVFTPRFMCEYKLPNLSPFKRDEKLTHFASTTAGQQSVSVPFKGPFDYVKYNNDGDTSVYSVNRPAPWAYPKDPKNPTEFLAQSGRGVEVELLQDLGAAQNILGGKTFTNPSALNPVGTPMAPIWCLPSQLRYRVRFCYPVDPQADPSVTTTDADGRPCVDPSKQYLLDTPVFDDISITFIGPKRILDYREVTE